MIEYNLSILILVSSAAFVAVKGKVPDFLHTCKRNDPELSKCVEESIRFMREKLSQGIPEFGTKPIDPMNIEELALDLAPGISAVGQNLQVTGIKNYEVKDMVADLDTDTFSFEFIVPGTKVNGNYEIEAKIIASFPFRGKGPIDISAKHVSGRVTLQGKKVTRNGKTRLNFPNAQLKLAITDFEIKLENLFEGIPQLGNMINGLVNLAKDRLMVSMLPAIEIKMAQVFLDYSNKVVSPFYFDELFTES